MRTCAAMMSAAITLGLGAGQAWATPVDCASELSAYAAFATTPLPDKFNFVVYEVVSSALTPTATSSLFSRGWLGGPSARLKTDEPQFSSQADAFKKQIARLVVELSASGELRLGSVGGPLRPLADMVCIASQHGAQAQPGLFVNGTIQAGFHTIRHQVNFSKWHQTRIPGSGTPTGVLIRD